MRAILLIAYGSSLPYAAENAKKQAGRLSMLSRLKVYTAFDRVNRPTVPEAVREMAADGVDDAAVLPFLIAEGVITKEHLPAKLGLDGPRSGTVTVDGRPLRLRLGRAVGADPGTAAIVVRRIKTAGTDPEAGILIVGHGSDEPENPAAVRATAEAVKKAGFRHTAVGFNEFCGPSIGEGLDELTAAGCDRIAVVPLFIACGLHLKEEIPEKLGLPPGKKHGELVRDGRTIAVDYLPAVGEDPLLAEVLTAQAAALFKE